MIENMDTTPANPPVTLSPSGGLTLPPDLLDAARLAPGSRLAPRLTASGSILLDPIGGDLTPEQEAEILAIVDEERRAYAAERRS
jgi:hypothetical protein